MTRARWRRVAHGRIWAATADKCDCGAYWFPHRTSSGACFRGGKADYYAAWRSVQA